MAKNVTLLGASYQDVPAVTLPQTGGGTATFHDVSGTTAVASDVLSGKTFLASDGTEVTGSIQSQETVTITPTRSTQTISAGTYLAGNVIINPIPDTYYTMSEAMEMMFPVGSIYMSTSDTAPTFGGTWVEIIMPATWGDVEDGMRTYVYGTGTGNVHFWKRTA